MTTYTLLCSNGLYFFKANCGSDVNAYGKRYGKMILDFVILHVNIIRLISVMFNKSYRV